jgi:phage terminase small subunit
MTKAKKKKVKRKKKPVDYDGSTPLDSVMQELFISNVILGMSDWDAYRNAGYKAKNPSSGALQLRKNTKVLARLKYKRAILQDKLDITEEKVLREFARLGFSNIQDYIEKGNTITDISTIARSKAAAVQSVTTDTRKEGDDAYVEKVKIQLCDKHKNLESLAKNLC